MTANPRLSYSSSRCMSGGLPCRRRRGRAARDLADDVLRLAVDVEVQAAEVLAEDAQGYQLQAAEEQHRDDDRGVPGDGDVRQHRLAQVIERGGEPQGGGERAEQEDHLQR